jgi:hypothetical protein
MFRKETNTFTVISNMIVPCLPPCFVLYADYLLQLSDLLRQDTSTAQRGNETTIYGYAEKGISVDVMKV